MPGVVWEWQDGVEVLMQLENAEIFRQLRSLLGKSYDISRTLVRIKKASKGTQRDGYKSELPLGISCASVSSPKLSR